MKALVGGMGVLIVIGVTVVVGTIVHRLYAQFLVPSNPVAAVSAPVAGVPVANAPVAGESGVPGLAAGERIQGIAAAGPDIAVWVSGPHGERVLLLNPVDGAVRVGLQGAP